jgi:hypothetical protein
MNDYFGPWEEDPDNYDHEEENMMGCDYGAEFCEDPQTKSMGLCTTECHLYFDMVKAQEKAFEEEVRQR